MLGGRDDDDPGACAYRRACEQYPGWQIRTDPREMWVAVRGGCWPLRLTADALATLVAQMERVELAECGELDEP